MKRSASAPSSATMKGTRWGATTTRRRGRALARDPVVLLLDEPFSAVDRPTRRRLRDDLSRLRRSLQIPIVLVTHDLDEAVGLADRLVVLDRGTVLQAGKPSAVLATPASLRVVEILDLPSA